MVSARTAHNAALTDAIEEHRTRMRLYLDQGLAEKAVDEFELMLEAQQQLAEWLRKTAYLDELT